MQGSRSLLQLALEHRATAGMPVNPISAAVSLYLGHGLGPSPQEDASRLTSRFGSDAPRLENQVRFLLAELDKIRPDWNAHTLLSGSQWAVAQLRCAHPELDDDAGTALIWAYSWWWK